MKIGIIITAFLRPNILQESLDSLRKFINDDFLPIIVNQGPPESLVGDFNKCHCLTVPFNSGLSYCRNRGVEIASSLNCDYVIISSDSFIYNSSLLNIYYLDDLLTSKYDLIGFKIENTYPWEAYMDLLPGQGFQLDFIDKIPLAENTYTFGQKTFNIWDCDIVPNFFIVKTHLLKMFPYREELKLAEHEASFWDWKCGGLIVGWTNFISAVKNTTRPLEYTRYREENFYKGLATLKKIYNISGWVSYKNSPRTDNG